jgi:glycosyltransferase involved in cell wall biosynthesis
MGISVIIPVFNGAEWLSAQFDALTRQDYAGQWELLVVDNDSADDSRAVAQRWSHRLPLHLENCQQRGVNAARNVGVSAARFDRLAFLDQDDVVDDHWLQGMADALDEHQLVGGRLDYERLNNAQVLAGREQQLATDELPKFRGAPHAIGCNMGCHRAVFDYLDGFDPELLPAADDVDFYFRAHHAGIEAAFAANAIVFYRLRGNIAEYRQQMRRYAIGRAQIDAKLRRLGLIPRQTWKSRFAALARHLRGMASVNLCISSAGRWRYAQRIGTATGAAIGFVRYRQLVI